MSWRIRHHYGHGAANVELASEPHFVAHRSLSMSGALLDAGRDFYFSCIPPLLLALFMFTALFVTVSDDKGYTDIEVVMMQDDLAELAEVVPEPEPVPVEPEPEPPKVVEKKPPPPPPVKKKVVKPEPPPVRKIAKAKPKPPPRARPKPKPKAKPKPRPVVKPQMEALAMRPEPKLAPAPARRGNRVREMASKPKMDLAPIAQAPKVAKQGAENRSRRFAAVRAPAPSSRPKADLGPPIAARSLSAPAPQAAPSRSRRAAPRNAAEKRQMAKVSFAGGSAPDPVASADLGSRARRDRPVAKPDRGRRAAPPPMELAAAAPAAPRTGSSGSTPRRTERARTERNSSSRTRSDHTASRGLAGVPLASLATCVSDGEEEALKRRLLAAVTTQRECVSRAGTYRFIETKNLNAFLMTIERSASRRVANRCEELQYALECVSR